MKLQQVGKKQEVVAGRKCYECGGQMEGSRGNYKYSECGLNSVNLVGIVVYHCSCGAIVPELPALSELHRLIAFKLIQKDTLLSGEEIRFLRKRAGLNGIEFAQLLGVHKTSLSKWENGTRTITKKTDATLRLLSFAAILQELMKLQGQDLVPKVAESVKNLSAVDINAILRQVQDRASGPKRVIIDPAELARFGTVDAMPVTESVQ